MQSEGKNYNSLAKSFHFSGDFVVSTWHSYADKGKGAGEKGKGTEPKAGTGRGRQKLEGLFKFQLVSKTFKKFPLLTDC